MKTRNLLILAFVWGLSGCAGSQGELPLDYDIPLKTRSTVTGFPLSQTYWNNYAIPAAVDALQFRESRRYGQQSATMFSHARSMWLSRITWLGRVENNSELLDGTALFILRVADGEYKNLAYVPKSLPKTEHLVKAEARLLATLESGYLYEFVYTDYSTFNVEAGNFWISIVDPEIEAMKFSWAVASGTALSSGAGSASVRTTDQGVWQSNVQATATKLEGGRLIDNP